MDVETNHPLQFKLANNHSTAGIGRKVTGATLRDCGEVLGSFVGISEEEKKLLAQHQILPNSMPKLAVRVAFEVVPAIIFVTAGLVTGSAHWFIFLISMMVFYNVNRVLKQSKNIDKLKSISRKTIGVVDK